MRISLTANIQMRRSAALAATLWQLHTPSPTLLHHARQNVPNPSQWSVSQPGGQRTAAPPHRCAADCMPCISPNGNGRAARLVHAGGCWLHDASRKQGGAGCMMPHASGGGGPGQACSTTPMGANKGEVGGNPPALLTPAAYHHLLPPIAYHHAPSPPPPLPVRSIAALTAHPP